MSAHPEFGELDNAKLAALLFELASQLHIERTQRLALESALVSSGAVTPEMIETAGETASFRAAAADAADVSIRKMLRVLSESHDERVPLRAEARDNGNGEH